MAIDVGLLDEHGMVDERKVLLNPPGDINMPCLENILYSVCEDNLPDSHEVQYLHNKRVEDFDPDYPDYVTLEEKMTVGELKKLYEEMCRRPYKFEKKIINHAIPCLLMNSKTGEIYVVDIGS